VEIRKKIRWNPEKAEKLIALRGLSMREIAKLIGEGRFTKGLNHRGQQIFEITIKDYPVDVPFVESEEHIFLKTAFHNRKRKPRAGDRHEAI
jgi:hypothetical protein